MRAHRLVALLALLLASRGTAAAQTLSGTLTDETTRAPVAGATVLLLDPAGRHLASTVTDDAGEWLISPQGRGPFSVRARKEGFATVETRPFFVDPLLRPLALRTRPEVPVLGEVSAPAVNFAGFLERRQARLGLALAPDEVRRRIDRVGALDPSRLVWGLIPGLWEDPQTQATLMPRRAGGPSCVPTLVIDGRRYDPTYPTGRDRDQAWDLDRLVTISEIRAVEIYPDLTWVPAAMAAKWLDTMVAKCGVIVLWTYKGIGVE